MKCDRVVRINPSRLLKMREGFLVSTAIEKCQPEVRPRAERVRSQLDGPLEVRDCFLDPPEFLKDQAKVRVRRGEVGPERQCLLERLNRRGEFSRVVIGEAERVEGFGIIRPKSQRGAATSDRAFEVTLVSECLAKVNVVNRHRGPHRERQSKKFHCACKIARLASGQPEEVKGLVVQGLADERAFQQFSGRIEVSAAAELVGPFEDVVHKVRVWESYEGSFQFIKH